MQFIILTFLMEINEVILKRVCLVIFINTISWFLNYFCFIILPRFIMPKFSFYLWKPVHYPVEAAVWAVCCMFNSMKKGQPLSGSCCLSVFEVTELRVVDVSPICFQICCQKTSKPQKRGTEKPGRQFFLITGFCIWKA